MILFASRCSADTRVLHSFLHDALPICNAVQVLGDPQRLLLHLEVLERVNEIPVGLLDGVDSRLDAAHVVLVRSVPRVLGDRKSTRLNSSHGSISYAVFCLKKKKTNMET